MDTSVNATSRAAGGKGEARKLRATGKVPASLYGPTCPPECLVIDPAELSLVFKNTQDRNTIVNLTVDGGTPVDVMVKDVQRHPVSRDILHVDFFVPTKAKEIEVMVPLRTDGRPAGAILGGRVRVIRRQVKVRCRYDLIPKEFVLDVSPMNIGDMIMASEIATPEGVQLVLKHDFNVVTVYGKRAAKGEGEAEAEAVEEEATA